MDIYLGLPQIIYLGLLFMSLIVFAAKHGKERTDTYSFPSALIGCLIYLILLVWGGFFQTPQTCY